MRKILFSLLTAATVSTVQAQVITFEELVLPKQDTFYLNYSQPGQDVGQDVGPIHFSCVYDTAWGGVWSGGFANSNKTDTVDGTYLNEYATIAGNGYNGSSNYAVYFEGYSAKKRILFSGAGTPTSLKKINGFYINNSTYAYRAMKEGNFASRKFGDTTGTNSGLAQGAYPDWFKLTIHAYYNGSKLNDSVDFYLADFRFNDNDSDYIVRDWQWVDLTTFGNYVDSLEFSLTSSDNHPIYGMNTPAYFCMDNLDVQVTLPTTVATTENYVAKLYPNPASTELFVTVEPKQVKTLIVTDMTGKQLAQLTVTDATHVISVAHLPSGMYLLQVSNGKQTAVQKFYKH